MSALLDILPADLRSQLDAQTARRGITAAQWIEEAVREKLAATVQMEYLEQRAARAKPGAMKRVLAQVPAAEPMPGDER